MADFHFIHPGDLATRTGGYRYARGLLDALRRRGVAAVVHRLADTFPFPNLAALADADSLLTSIADGSTVVVDGLAFGAMPALAARHAARLKLVALVHHPLALETGLAPDAAAQLEASEREALRSARAIVVTSPATALALRAYGIDASRVTVVLPGTEARIEDGPRAGSASDRRPDAAAAPVRLLCVASVTPRKGQLELVEALAACRSRYPAMAWRLVCIGSLERDAAYAAVVRARARELGLGALVEMAGERDEEAVDRAYDDADLFVLPSFHEGYGMVLAEALAHGLPVLSTTAGAIPQTVPAGAAVLVAPGDVSGLADALGQVIGRPDLRLGMAAAARRAARSLPDWETAAGRFLALLESVQGGGGGGGGADAAAGAAAKAPAAPQGFAPSWLALREPHDHAARAEALTGRLAGFLRERSSSSARSRLRILDLGCGTGSTLRYLAPRLGGTQDWTLVDNDAALLAALPTRPVIPMRVVDGLQLRLSPVLLDLVDGFEQLSRVEADVVTASALLDLVSAQWLDRLVAGASAAAGRGKRRPALLLALSYDGVIAWQPLHADDGWAADLFNRHQRGDKGFGPALGPSAADEAARRLRQAGYEVTLAPSPWRLDSGDGAIQREFLAGVAGAVAAAAAGAQAARLQAWLQCREAWLAQGISAVEVGHRDLLALPIG